MTRLVKVPKLHYVFDNNQHKHATKWIYVYLFQTFVYFDIARTF